MNWIEPRIKELQDTYLLLLCDHSLMSNRNPHKSSVSLQMEHIQEHIDDLKRVQSSLELPADADTFKH